jgi:hypothetical protein
MTPVTAVRERFLGCAQSLYRRGDEHAGFIGLHRGQLAAILVE